MAKQRTYSKYALNAALLLGEEIKTCRKLRGWSETELAERAGISRATLQKIEKGDMSCAIGLVFEVATLVGVKLFEGEASLSDQIHYMEMMKAVLPKRIRAKEKAVKDDF